MIAVGLRVNWSTPITRVTGNNHVAYPNGKCPFIRMPNCEDIQVCIMRTVI